MNDRVDTLNVIRCIYMNLEPSFGSDHAFQLAKSDVRVVRGHKLPG